MDDSGQVDSVVLSPPSADNWHASFTHTTKIIMPSLVTIILKDGQTFNIIPVMLGNGASRDVIGGMLQNTTTQSSWIVKIQAWRWHETSNGHEYRLGTGALECFTPKMSMIVGTGKWKGKTRITQAEHTSTSSPSMRVSLPQILVLNRRTIRYPGLLP